MNILLVNLTYFPYIGGIENSFRSMAKEFLSLGHNVTLVCSDLGVSNDSNIEGEEIEGVKITRFRRTAFKFGLFNMFFDFINCFFLLRKIQKNITFDFSVLRHPSTGLATVFALKKTKNMYLLPAISKLQDFNEAKERSLKSLIKHLYRNKLLIGVNHFIQRKLIEKSYKNFVFSEQMIKQVLTEFPNLKLKNEIRIVKPGVDSNRFKFIKNKSMPKKELNIDKNTFVFISICRLISIKGLEYTIRAFSKVEGDYIYLIIGEGPQFMALLNLIKQLGLEDKIIIKDKTFEPEKYYDCADCFLLPSVYEPFGQTILEALSSGIPVIAFNSNEKILTATNELISQKEGLLVDFEEEYLIASIQTMLNMEKKYLSAMRLNAHVKAKQFTWLNLCERFIYESK